MINIYDMAHGKLGDCEQSIVTPKPYRANIVICYFQGQIYMYLHALPFKNLHGFVDPV